MLPAPDCAEHPCRNDGAIVFDEHFILCAEHAREELKHRCTESTSDPDPRFGARSLISPRVDICVILRDKEPIASGRIIIPEIAKDRHGRIKGEDEFATGLILATGPGYQGRGGAGGISGAYIAARKAMRSKPGMHVIFRAKHAEAIVMWRGLCLVHDFDVLSELIEESAA